MTASGAPNEPVHAPSLVLGEAGLQGRSVHVGGRLLFEGERWHIADAFAALDVACEEIARGGGRHGSLVVAAGTLQGRTLCGARIVTEQHASADPALLQHLRAGLAQRLVERARIFAEVRAFFTERGFCEIETPLRSAECATEVHVEPIQADGAYLITSPELHMKRLLVAGVPRLFQLARCFRAGERGPLHSPEFTLLEWYRAFSPWTAVLEDTEQLVYALCSKFARGSVLELAGGRRVDVTPPFLRISVREAFQRFAGVEDASRLAEHDEGAYFQLLVDRVEPRLAELERPVFLCDYPASQAALARRSPADPSVAERFELYLAGVELCNGYGELNDPAEQRARCVIDRERRASLGLPVPPMPERFLTALEQGMPPASGNALGLDRLIMLIGGHDRIDAVRPFSDDEA